MKENGRPRAHAPWPACRPPQENCQRHTGTPFPTSDAKASWRVDQPPPARPTNLTREGHATLPQKAVQLRTRTRNNGARHISTGGAELPGPSVTSRRPTLRFRSQTSFTSAPTSASASGSAPAPRPHSASRRRAILDTACPSCRCTAFQSTPARHILKG